MRDRDLIVGLALALGTLVACGGSSTFADAAPADAGVDVPQCPAIWTVTHRPGASASVSAGALRLEAANFPAGAAVSVAQAGLTGDFDLRFEVDMFTSGGSGSFVQARLYQDAVSPDPRFLSAGMGTIPTVGVSAADQPAGPTDIKDTTGTSGTFWFQRTGSTVVVTATGGATGATVTATGFDLTPLVIELQLGSNNGTVAGTAAVQVSAFSATGSGVTDGFDCDSLK